MSVIIGIIVLVSIVLVHEFGHFIAAKALGLPVKEFSLGFGPKVIYKTWRGTVYSVRAVWLGGFVLLDEKLFEQAKSWKKILVYLSGPAINLISAITVVTALAIHFEVQSPLLTAISFITYIITMTVQAISTMSFGAMAGPVGIVDSVAQVVQVSPLTDVALITAMIHVCVGLTNLLPLPLFDGGRVLMTAVHLRPDIAKIVYASSAIVLLALSAVLTGQDIYRILTR
ncbi:MAG: site-2 protease family protein [Peptococcaceae bacterium]|nr:site-2 protease family protein [Peptococcaceae bacterium]